MSGLSFSDGLPLECERSTHALRRVSRRVCFAGSMGGLTLLGGLPCFAGSFDDPLWARAPLNTDITLLDAPPVLQWALLSLAVLMNMVVLAGIVYAVARHEAEFSNFALVYLGVLIGGLLASLLLSPLIYAWTGVLIILFNAFLLTRVCLVQFWRALLAAFFFQAYQLGWLLALRAVSANQ